MERASRPSSGYLLSNGEVTLVTQATMPPLSGDRPQERMVESRFVCIHKSYVWRSG